MGNNLETKINDYENKISNNQAQIQIHEEQIEKLLECVKGIAIQKLYIDEEYPSNLKFKSYAYINSLWYGENKSKYIDDVDSAYEFGIKAFVKGLNAVIKNINSEITSISNKIDELKFENIYYIALKGNLELEKRTKEFIEEIL